MTNLTLPVQLDRDSLPDETLYVTASGLPVRIYSDDGSEPATIHGAIYIGREWEPRSWLSSGKYERSGADHAFDLRDRAPVKRGVWVARWLSHLGAEYLTHHDTKEGACEPSIYPSPKLLSVNYCADGDGLSTPADPPLVVDWSKLPEWAKWAAVSPSGLVCGYKSEPREARGVWSATDLWKPLNPGEYRLAPGFDWRETLIQRPEVQND